MHIARDLTFAMLLGTCFLVCGCREPGSAGKRGASCSMQTAADGSVHVECEDGSQATLRPPTPADVDGGRARPCRFERTAREVVIECPDGSRVVLPTDVQDGDAGAGIDAGAPQACEVSELTPGQLTITCPDGTSAQLPAEPREPVAATRRVGASAAACGGCHDDADARAHFRVMSQATDAGVSESCSTCHAETGIRPVAEAHARPGPSMPGLHIQIESASVDALTRELTVQVRLADRSGAPITSAGTELKWWIARVGTQTSVDGTTRFAGPYENYLLETVTQRDHPNYPLGNFPPRVVQQPRTEQGGTLVPVHPGVDDGLYAYRFSFALPEGYAADLTHVIGVVGTRNAAGTRFVDVATYFFAPSPAVTALVRRESVRSEVCQNCHADFRAHGGGTSDIQWCLGCHSQGAIDPETNQALDFDQMIHRIHRGRDLPSVKTGTAYGFVAEEGRFEDFSRVGYPQPIANCQGCHTDGDDRWLRDGTRKVCTSCLELLDLPWAQGGHPFALEPDATCSSGNCHGVSGRVRDAREAHLTVLNDPKTPVFKLELLRVEAASGGQPIAVHARGRIGKRSTPEAMYVPLTTVAQLSALEVFINGPTQGYLKDGNTLKHYSREQLVSLAFDPSRPGEFSFILPEPFRASVSNLGDPQADSYSLSLAAAYDPTPAGLPDNDRTWAELQPVKAVSVSEVITPRRQVVSTQACNACHGALSHHTGALFASAVEQCVMCHTATLDTRVRQSVARVSGTTQSLRLSTLIHRLHGAKTAIQPYQVFGDAPSQGAPSYSVRDLSALAYPADVRECARCHVSETYGLPVSEFEPASTTTALQFQ